MLISIEVSLRIAWWITSRPSKDKDETGTLDYEGGSPTDPRSNRQISSLTEYVDEDVKLQSGVTQTFTGDGSTTTFTLTTAVLDFTRIAVFLNGVQQEKLKNDEIISKVVALVEKKEKDIKNKI